MSISAATQEGNYLKTLTKDVQNKGIATFTLYCNCQNAIALRKNPIHHHIRFHFIRNELQNETQII